MSRLAELNTHLFDQLNRLSDPEITSEELDLEVKRAKVITDVSKQVIDCGQLAVSAEKVRQEYRAPAGSDKQLLKEL